MKIEHKIEEHLINNEKDLENQYKLLKNRTVEIKSNKKEDKEDINIIVLTNRIEDSDNLFRTANEIQKVCKKKGVESYIVFAEDASIIKEDDDIKIYNSDDDKGFLIEPSKTAIIVRGSVMRYRSSLNLLSQLEKNGFFLVNNRNCIETCSDKYRTILKLSDAGIICPKTFIIRTVKNLDKIIENLDNKFPLILKTLSGSKGSGVFFVESLKSLKGVVDMIWKINKDEELLIQEYIKTDYDIRVHVLNNEVIASMKRYVIEDDFRSNYSLGGKVEKIKLNKDIENICIEASKAVGCIWGGVDFIFNSKGKPFVIEINSSPGTEGIEKASKINVTEMLVEYVLNKDNWIKIAQECGHREMVEILGIGNFVAKFDTGNSSSCVLHTDDFEIKDKYVEWRIDDKKYKHKVKIVKEVKVGGLRDYKEKRPVIEIDIKFNNVIYKNIEFTLDNREGRSPILINREFMKKANIMINPSKRFYLTKKI